MKAGSVTSFAAVVAVGLKALSDAVAGAAAAPWTFAAVTVAPTVVVVTVGKN